MVSTFLSPRISSFLITASICISVVPWSKAWAFNLPFASVPKRTTRAWSTSRVRVWPAGEQNGQAADELGRFKSSKQARLMQTMNESQNRRFRKQAKKEAIMLDLLGLT